MSKKTIYITRKLPQELLDSFSQYFHFRMWDQENIPVPREVLQKELRDVDGLLCLVSDTIDGQLMESAKNLKVIATMSVGFDHIDIPTAKKRGIMVSHTPDILTETTADLAFALLMATARRLVEANSFMKQGHWEQWSPYLLAGTDIYQKKIGIVGMGRIGEAIARRSKGFEMNILYHNRRRRTEVEERLGATYCDFKTLLKQSDFVVSTVPLTKDTTRLFDKEAFVQMKSSGIFINISRGQVVDEEALIQALREGEIQAAGLDVYEQEPISQDHPLLSMDQVVCLPHIGSASRETRTRMIQHCLDNLHDHFYGDGVITPVT